MHFVGSIAICPVESTPTVHPGGNVTLSVYVFGIPAVQPNEISWIGPQLNTIVSGGRFTLLNGNRGLNIQGAQNEDSGNYHINLARQISPIHFLNAHTFVNLDVDCK